MAHDLCNVFIFQILFFYFHSKINQPLKFLQLAVNLQKLMIFSVFNDGIQCFVDFGHDSVTIAVNGLVHEKTISSQEIALAAWHLLLS